MTQKLTKLSLSKKKRNIFSYWAAVLWAAIIMLLCGLPSEELPNIDFWDIDIEDKLAHAGVFFILGFSLFYGRFRRKAKPITKKDIVVMTLIVVAYGAVTEIFQELFFPSRFGDFFDFIADAIGGVLGIVFAKWMFSKKDLKNPIIH